MVTYLLHFTLLNFSEKQQRANISANRTVCVYLTVQDETAISSETDPLPKSAKRKSKQFLTTAKDCFKIFMIASTTTWEMLKVFLLLVWSVKPVMKTAFCFTL